MNVSGRSFPSTDEQPSEGEYRERAALRLTMRQIERLCNRQAKEAGIAPQQYLLLVLVRGHSEYPQVSISQIAELLQTGPQGASLLVERAVDRGLLIREEDPSDRRRALISLSKEGQDILDSVIRATRRELGMLVRELQTGRQHDDPTDP